MYMLYYILLIFFIFIYSLLSSVLFFYVSLFFFFFFFFQAEDGIRDIGVTGVQTCALPISRPDGRRGGRDAQRRPILAREPPRPDRRRVRDQRGRRRGARSRREAALPRSPGGGEDLRQLHAHGDEPRRPLQPAASRQRHLPARPGPRPPRAVHLPRRAEPRLARLLRAD